jgi:hypothetical protein
MDLFETIIFEFLLGYILQAFTFILGVFAFNRQKIVLKKYILVSIVVSVSYYLVRLLPISFGVHTIICLILMFLVCIFIFKMPIYATIRSTLLITVLLLSSEMANVWLMISILGQEKFEQKMSIPLEKAIVGLPSALTFAILILLSYFIFTKSRDHSAGPHNPFIKLFKR